MQRFNFTLIFVSLFAAFSLLASLSARAHSASREEVVSELQAWRNETAERKDLDEREQDLRLEMISRLTFQIERKYLDENLQTFYIETLKSMAKTDQNQSNQSFGSMDVFLVSLSVATAELMERSENPTKFLRSFTEFSGISDPCTLEEFAETRQYYDGSNMYKAKPLDLEMAGDWLEQLEKTALAPPLLFPVLLDTDKDLNRHFQLEVPPETQLETPTDLMLQNSSNPNDESSRP